MRPTILSFLFLLILHSVSPTWSIATEETITFRYGLNGYTGVRDTFISTLDWGDPPQDTVNYGQNEAIVLSRDGGENPLVRFALEAIPPNSRIASAALSLYNTVPSSLSGSRDFARRITLHQTLVDWDEGNQQDSPINASGKRGATGYNAFAFFSGEGVNVPWAERGMKAGADYKEKAEGYADVVNEGWYNWDVTALVQQWIRGDAPNFGVTLRDATGFQDDHRDNREFVSSQSGDASLRPKLTVVYNPDVPFARAGVDQENLQWNGGSVRLDGSGSSDRPGGNDAALAYSWSITAAAYGSSLTGAVLGTTAIVDFVPDRAGEWDVELTVTNDQGESATDTVHLRLLRIPASHPRIYLDPAKLAQLKSLAVPSNPRWTQLKDQADQSDGDMQAKALVWQITGEEAYADEAIALALNEIPSTEWAMKAGNIALVFDWCYSRLTPQQIADFVAYFNAWDDVVKEEDAPGWGNYWPGWSYSYALIGLASYGDDNPRAQEWMDEYRHRRYRDNDLSLLNQIADSGAWPEGTVYDGLANRPRIKAVEAWRTATGEDLFESTAWFRNRLGCLLLRNWPGEADQWGTFYRPYPATGDSERNRGSMANYSRIMGLILAGHYPQDPIASQLHAYLATAPVNRSMDFVCHDEFLWFNPAQSSSTPEILTHYAKATGTLFMRSGWPDGAADTLTSPTYLTFQCGDHFTYHQHFEQNSFTLFKYGDLAVDSGVYSGDGLSNHDINYYVRTIAHNTLAVYNPQEDFSSVRADASSNDGGQRTMYPASRSPQTVAYFQQYQTQYDNGDILRYEDNSYFTYALGDATKAYNNPSYNQAMDTDLTGNIAKVSRFQREFVYLRSPNSGGQDYLVLLDRVGVTQADFSGPNTKLLFHTLGEPVVNGTAQTITPGEVLYGGADLAWAVSGDGKLFLKFLLPLDRNVRKVGGREVKAFWVFGKRYDWQWEEDEDQPRPINEYEEIPYGEWRLELEPADPLLNHTFLTVLFPTSSTVTAPPAAQLITGTGMTGVYIPNSALDRVALFSSAIDGSAPSGIISYQYPQNQDTHTTLFDLTPGARYRLTATLEGGIHHITLTPDVSGPLLVSDQGVLSFSSSTAVFYVSSDGACDGHTPCYKTIQDAINAAPSGATIRIAEGTYGQAYALNNGRVLTLKGRWNKAFTAQTGNPTIIKAPSGVVGGLTFQEVSMAP